jgi:hypothetical protein
MTMTRASAAIAVPFAALFLSACVSQQTYDAVVAENNQLKAQLSAAQSQLAASQAQQRFVEAGDYLFPALRHYILPPPPPPSPPARSGIFTSVSRG